MIKPTSRHTKFLVNLALALVVAACAGEARVAPTATPAPTQPLPSNTATRIPAGPPPSETPVPQAAEDRQPQAELRRLTEVDDLKAMFNQDKGMPRLILLLSTSCPSCVAGAAWVQQAILEKYPSTPLRIYAIWFPIRGGAQWDENAITDPRVVNLWDPGRKVSTLFAKNIPLAGTPRAALTRTTNNIKWGEAVWDVFYLYGADATWDEAVPAELQDSGYPIIQHRETIQTLVTNEPLPVIAIPDTTEVVFKIVPVESLVSYGVHEEFMGLSSNYAIGVTSEVTGEIKVNLADPALSQIGPVTINIHSFKSDNVLRDERIQELFLQSAKFPLAVFTSTQILGLPGAYTAGEVISFQVQGDLQVRDRSVPTTFDVALKLEAGRLQGIATTHITMTDFGFNPPSIAGMVQTEDRADLAFEFVAEPVNH